MAKFKVGLKETVFYTVEVEAADYDDAEAAAIECWVQSEDPMHDFAGAGNGVEVNEIEKVEG